MKERDESKILDILETKKTIHYTDLINELEVCMETARSRCIEIAKKYPKNVEYIRGLLRLKKSLTFNDLPSEKQIKALQQTIKTKQAKEEKLKKNHLPCLERAVEEANLKKIVEEVKKLKQLFGEK